ncbi:cytoskeletal protein RodZ [Gracilibacillus halotolerans]|uniref:Cytoskeletal protein RodZ n=1 Tax=Gracilibacillus halotolerans TaxID=74386 RepID=A0A841RHI6_9BACI|nr:helix-turn-helix domain-containing protein [Gracilibacillus halotolerans]MBB6511502.1 cytoskeletal protein RodZ [Gracilibacillus halotolerans]
MGIGERLKQERELRNMSLDDIQKQTKIQIRYLEAIEKERFHVMPGSFYVRAFIKEYSNVLGLDYNELMNEYEHALPFEKEEPTNISRVKSSRRNKTSTKTPVIFSFLPTVIVVLLIIGLLVFIWLFQQGFFSNDDNPVTDNEANNNTGGESVQLPPPERAPEPTEEDETETNDNEEEEVDEQTEETEPVTEVTSYEYSNNESRYTVESTEEKIILTFSSEESWLEVYNDSDESFVHQVLTDEDSPLELDITGETEIYVKFAQPQFMSYNINGVPLELSEEIAPNSVQEAWITIETTTDEE